ncbi:PadR family transcriptional regulator [Eoetvoesiella caeni]
MQNHFGGLGVPEWNPLLPRRAAAGRGRRPGAGAPLGDWDGMGGDGARMTRGRKFGADELQLMLLALLHERPGHGYEFIKELEARSNGFYSPSPGMVYPALTYLEELGYATVEVHGNRKLYHLAEPGRLYLEANRDRADLLFASLKHAARKIAWMKQAWSNDTDPGTIGVGGWLPEFVEARRAMKTALLRRTDATPDEQRRIAVILKRATSEILNEGATPSTQA